jgi:hypothetical protein
MNNYFSLIFEKVFQQLYRIENHQTNEMQCLSDSINDICDFCDSESLKEILYNFLMMLLQEIANSTDPNAF